jgi:spermidine synthase
LENPTVTNVIEGIHIIAVLKECKCPKNFLIKSNYTGTQLEKFVKNADLTVVASEFYSFNSEFDQHGFSGSVILAESHLNIHTWPESDKVNISIHVCNYERNNVDKAHNLFNQIKTFFKPEKISYSELLEVEEK